MVAISSGSSEMRAASHPAIRYSLTVAPPESDSVEPVKRLCHAVSHAVSHAVTSP